MLRVSGADTRRISCNQEQFRAGEPYLAVVGTGGAREVAGGRGSMNLQVDAVVVAVSFGFLPYINDSCLINKKGCNDGQEINDRNQSCIFITMVCKERERFRLAGRDSGWSGSMKSRYMRQPQKLEWLDNTGMKSGFGIRHVLYEDRLFE